MEMILSVLVAALSILLVAVVLMQSGKDEGLGALSGNSESFMNKTGKDGKSAIAASTKWIALAWLVLVLAMNCL